MKDWNEWIWKRPQSTEFPKIWRTFTAKDSDSDRLVEFRIEDLTESRYDEAIEIMVQLFCNGEPLCTALGGGKLNHFFLFVNEIFYFILKIQRFRRAKRFCGWNWPRKMSVDTSAETENGTGVLQKWFGRDCWLEYEFYCVQGWTFLRRSRATCKVNLNLEKKNGFFRCMSTVPPPFGAVYKLGLWFNAHLVLWDITLIWT